MIEFLLGAETGIFALPALQRHRRHVPTLEKFAVKTKMMSANPQRWTRRAGVRPRRAHAPRCGRLRREAMPINRIPFQPGMSLPKFFARFGTEAQWEAALAGR